MLVHDATGVLRLPREARDHPVRMRTFPDCLYCLDESAPSSARVSAYTSIHGLQQTGSHRVLPSPMFSF